MLNLSEENKALCFSDSVSKPLYIFLYFLQGYDQEGHAYWRYFKTIDDAIVLESMSIDEGILDGNTFELGSFIVPTIKVKWRNDGIRYKDMVAVPVQKIGTQYIAYFDGYISSEEIEEDGRTVSAEIVSFLGERLNIDVLDTIKSYSGYTFYEMVQNALGQTADIWIKGSETDELLKKFSNANTIITLNQNTLPKTLTAGELLKQSGEFLGGHIILKEKRIVNIDDMKNYQPTGMPIIDFIRFANVDTVAEIQTKPLPKEYKILPYIHFSGQQYIDTGVIPNGDTNAEYVVTVEKYKPYGTHILSTKQMYFPFFRILDGVVSVFWNWLGNEIPPTGFEKPLGIKHKIKAFSNGEVLVDKTQFYATMGTQMVNDTLYLGTYGGDPTDTSYAFVGKVYSCKISDGYTIIRDFIPCVRTQDNKVGMYDLVNNTFYGSDSGYDFLSSNPIETYTLPYYINLSADKTNRVKFDLIRVLTETGDSQTGQKNYTVYWNENVKSTYEIKGNIFFEGLSAENWENCEKAVVEVAAYISDQNLYYADLQTVYPPFIEGGDCLLIKPKSELPSDYIELSSITLGDFITDIVPDGSYFEFDIEFEAIENGLNMIFESGDIGYQNTVRLYTSSEDSLIFEMGYYGESIPFGSGFEIEHYPKNQKIKLNIKRGNNKCIYSGTFNGVTEYPYMGNEFIGAAPILFYPCKFYHFAYSQDGVKICDLKPCIRKSDKAIGVYNTVNGEFIEAYGMGDFPQYETLGTVIPVLSSNANGIHSMKADIVCKATNTNKK